ncbi:MAG TPA: DUF2167 domain-containing protein [Chthoniobacterales bacterium]|nr:DUF2167 domain-containing protein [Chthoniobacterales bacterium]
MKPSTLLFLFLALIVISTGPGYGQDRPKNKQEAEAIAAGLKFQEGEIVLKDGLATLKVPEGLRFLNGHDAWTVLVQLWNNPPMPSPLGLIMPADAGPLDPNAWAVIITYEEEGYVKDKDAEKIDYADLLKQMQKDARETNKERQKQGYSTVELVGWAAPPHYDKTVHKLYWAKQLKFSGGDEDTLNYNIRILGRRGVLVLNAVAAMSQLPEIERSAPKILSAIDFNPGNRYADFSEASGDKVASYGIAALVAGGVAAKLGLFKGLWVLLLGAKKFVVIGVVALVAFLRKLFGRNKAATNTDGTTAS